MPKLHQNHFHSFYKKYALGQSKKLYISFSAGVDSVVLLDLLYSFGYSDSITLIHYNHLNRKSNAKDVELTKQLAKKYKVEFKVVELENLPAENFEQNARKARYESLKKLAGKNTIFMGHHIDDSFEWSLMQQFKSSSLRSSIGIPVKNNNIERPLMCFSKQQILEYAKRRNLKWNEDPTNECISYERNYVRNILIPVIKEKYPSYLKHYIKRAKSLANKYDLLHLKLKRFRKRQGESFFEIFSLDHSGELDMLDELIEEGVKHLSSSSRGSLRLQIEKIKKALQNNSLGPLLLSGGVKAFIQYNHIYLSQAEPVKVKLTSIDKVWSYGELLSLVHRTKGSFFNSYIKVDKKIKGFTYIKRDLPFESDSFGRISVINLLRQWQKSQNIDKKLSLKF